MWDLIKACILLLMLIVIAHELKTDEIKEHVSKSKEYISRNKEQFRE